MSLTAVAAALRINPSATADSLNAPIRTARPHRVTMATISDTACWGFVKAAAFQAALKASGHPSADTLLGLLNGPGFSTSDPQIEAMIPNIVALADGTINEADAVLAIFATTYACGTPDVTNELVTAAQAVIAFEDAKAAAVALVNQAAQAVIAEWDERHRLLLDGEEAAVLTPEAMAELFAEAVGVE